MDTVDVLGPLVPVTCFLFLLAERLWPAREFAPCPGWQWIDIGFLLAVTTISTVVPRLPSAGIDDSRDN